MIQITDTARLAALGIDPADSRLRYPLVTRVVAQHGDYSYQPLVFDAIMKRTKASLVDEVVDMFDGGDLPHGGKKSHWQGRPKADLAAIVAFGDPVEDLEGRVIGGGAWRRANGMEE